MSAPAVVTLAQVLVELESLAWNATEAEVVERLNRADFRGTVWREGVVYTEAADMLLRALASTAWGTLTLDECSVLENGVRCTNPRRSCEEHGR